MILGFDPQSYVLSYLMTSWPMISILLRTLTFHSEPLLTVVILSGRFVTMTVALYEGERLLIIVLGSIYIIIYTAATVVGLLGKLVIINRRRIQIGLFHRHIRVYTMLILAVHAVEDIVNMTLSIVILATTVVLVTITFVSVRLGHLLPGYLVLIIVSAGIFGFLLAKTLLTKTASIFKNVVELLEAFKGVEIVGGMRRGVRLGYLRDVRRFDVLKIPIGVGSTVFTTVDKNTNVRLSRLFVEVSVNALILF